ncbi:plastocyanin/azurin family copper-binding protein [Haloarchaeobius sp. TZWWS8]|uniref:plastocyanin/azurin family copper-binding protein n=1 Tax=Haloarchaeobius sp. TZWWS8 TaxID=3446121 RepID=UPI003EB6D3B8
MNDSESPTRRTVLRTAGGTALLALAGCLGSQSTGEKTETTTTTTTGGEETTAGDGSSKETDDGHGGDGHGHGSELDGPKSEATVTMKTTDSGNHFEPHVVWVEKGATVTFELESGAHSVTAYTQENDKPGRIPEGAKSFDSGTLSESGATFEHTFETEGVYDYFCIPHHAMGMIGSVIVGEPAPDGQPGLAKPQSSLPEKAQKKITELNEKVETALSGDSSDGHSDETSHSNGEETTNGTTTDGHDH